MKLPTQLQDSDFRFVLIKSKEKIPFEKEWTTKNNYHYNHDKVFKHKGNLGILTGDGLIIIDCDTKELENITRNTLPETFVVGTSLTDDGFRKKHYYFKCPREEKVVVNYLGIHYGEVQAKGQQCIVPGSTHWSGTKYEIIEDNPIAEITEEQLIKALEPFVDLRKKKPINVVKITQGVLEGSRNDAAIRLATFGRRSGLMKEETLISLELWNKKNDPPLDNNELISVLESAYKGEGYSYYFKEKPLVEGDLKDCEFDSKDFFTKWTEGKNKGDVKNFVPVRLGEFIKKKYTFRTIRGSDDIYYYINGVYVKNGRELIRELCAGLLGELHKKNHTTEVIFYTQSTTYIEAYEIDNGWMNLENGLLNPLTGEFKEHTDEIFTTVRIPIVYNQEADCPLFKEKLGDKVDKKTMTVIQEMFGYCFLPGQEYQRAFLLYGPRRSMKSTVLDMLVCILGKDNIRAFPLQFLTKNDFGVAYLFGKMANICADLSSDELRHTGKFMEIVGGDPVEAVEKYGHPFTFKPSSKLIFSCNNIPGTTNNNIAFYRRWILLEFPNSHPEGEIDFGLSEKLKNELPGILNWAIGGLRRLVENEKFSYWLSEYEIKDLYERNASPVQSFINRMIDCENDTASVKKRVIYEAYKKYCEENDLKLLDHAVFGKKFKNITGAGHCEQEKIPAYRGVGFIDRTGKGLDKYV